MAVKTAFEKGFDRSTPESVTEKIDKAKAKKDAEEKREQDLEATFTFDPVEAAAAQHDELGEAFTALEDAVDGLVEMLALMKHPNQRPALRAIALEKIGTPASVAQLAAFQANRIERAVTEFKKGGA